MSDIAQPKPEPTRAEVVGALAARLTDDSLGTGPIAELRRLNPDGPLSEPALHRMLARYVPDGWIVAPAALRDWALVIHCLGLAAPDGLRGQARLGTALHDAGFGETRFVNLLDASPDELRDRLPRAVRFLVTRGGRLHGPQLADLVLTPRSVDSSETVRQRIAADYYRAEYRASRPDDTITA